MEELMQLKLKLNTLKSNSDKTWIIIIDDDTENQFYADDVIIYGNNAVKTLEENITFFAKEIYIEKRDNKVCVITNCHNK